MTARASLSTAYWDRGRLARTGAVRRADLATDSTADVLLALRARCGRDARGPSEELAATLRDRVPRRPAGETPAVPVRSCFQHPRRNYYRAKHWILYTVGACVAIFCFNFARPANWSANLSFSQSNQFNEDRIDRDLTLAATTALGERVGTVIVMDPRTGRVRAVVNPGLAFGAAFPPGSTIKPFSALAALRTGTIKHDSRISCREHYSHEGFTTVCSHPRDLPPLKPAEAIAYSCNYYFGKLGEQLSESSFDTTLAEFGFGRPTGVNWIDGQHEPAGKLPDREWRAQNALGESDQIQVTPIQLLTAYSALVNGGHLFIPRIAQEKDFLPQLRAELKINEEDRQLIVEGMRGSVRYGTAERAGLDSLPLYVFGKTGTSTELGGFRTHGWFIGVGSKIEETSPEPSKSPELAVLIFLKRGHGVEAAEIARPIFDAYVQASARGARAEDAGTRRPGDTGTRGRADAETRGHGDAETRGRADTGTRGHGDAETRGPADAETRGPADAETQACEVTVANPLTSSLVRTSPRLRVPASPRLHFSAVPASVVKVHLVRENTTRSMSLEDYVLGVVAAEGSTETEIEGLKALAIASRTYALKNLHRHANEGYDFCTTTHCQ
ncbi:MAG: penicillin-binding transpeptidase domain-containing protein, partial [Pyrinomonadaceae bacterium]